jgi:hypothetical protein
LHINNLTGKKMYKTKWLTPSAFADFTAHNARQDGYIYCASCGVSETAAEMTVDHIVPRIEGGSDDISNLQPMCRSCNSRKNSRPDTYWSKKHYFDSFINRDKLRVSQSDFVMHPVEGNPEFFGRPFSAINRKLFTYAQIVGAGKTLGMFSLPFAINACAHPNAPRIDKMLIVSKNSSLVSQIANELEHEPVDYGIVSEAPRVSVIDSAAKMFGEASDHDIAVMCPNMLWPNRDMASAEDVIVTWHPASADMMRRYPLIIFDEMHYAYDNIRRLLPIATNSLVFGFTATPIDGAGDLLNDIVLMSVYGYRDAQINDGSMMKLNYTATH